MEKLPKDFHSVLSLKFEAASLRGDIVFGGSSKSEIVTRDVGTSKYDFHFSLLESLEYRPDKGDKKHNPFENPEPELTILDNFGKNDEFRLVLNKFPVAPEHFMLVTKEFRSQNTPLSPSELLATFSILAKLNDSSNGTEWFAFYNCGTSSGASQPHKHVQFMRQPQNYTPLAELIAKPSEPFIPSQTREPLKDSNLPFAHFVAKLPKELSEDTILLTFYSLVQRMLNVFRDYANRDVSYNFCATVDYMMLVPRRAAKFKNIGINSCAFMGLALCKSEDVYGIMKAEGFENILEAVAFPGTMNCASEEFDY